MDSQPEVSLRVGAAEGQLPNVPEMLLAGALERALSEA